MTEPKSHYASPEHIALLEHPGRFESLHRKNDFLDEGVHTVFGVRDGRAELQAFFFQADKFTPLEARDWLQERGFQPLLFQGLK